MKSVARSIVTVTLAFSAAACGQSITKQASTKPLPRPKFSQTALPPNARKSIDSTGRTIVGTDGQKMHLLDPNLGAQAAGSRRPALINAQQQAAGQELWKTYTPQQKKDLMAKAGEKIREAHLAYTEAHPENVLGARPKQKGSVEIALHGTQLRFNVDTRQNDIPVGFRDISGNRVLKMPAMVKNSTSTTASAYIPKGTVTPSSPAKPGAWHKMDAVMKSNRQTGEHLAFLKS